MVELGAAAHKWPNTSSHLYPSTRHKHILDTWVFMLMVFGVGTRRILSPKLDVYNKKTLYLPVGSSIIPRHKRAKSNYLSKLFCFQSLFTR